mmetsp:Transcript_55307/g.154032  ORF Transcript_55307/g.154032 Transcript_55307/m.154032 type:complete len:288 (+) Transcript_55307:76-939(+)
MTAAAANVGLIALPLPLQEERRSPSVVLGAADTGWLASVTEENKEIQSENSQLRELIEKLQGITQRADEIRQWPSCDMRAREEEQLAAERDEIARRAAQCTSRPVSARSHGPAPSFAFSRAASTVCSELTCLEIHGQDLEPLPASPAAAEVSPKRTAEAKVKLSADYVDSEAERARAVKAEKAKAEKAPKAPVQPPIASVSFVALIDRSTCASLGIRVRPNKNFLEVSQMKNDGLVPDWNRRNPDKVVQEGDRIVEVNGRRGNVDELKAECKKDVLLQMTLERCSSA